jgi:ribosome recycling factor
MSTIATTKDAVAQAKVRMEKAVEDFRRELAGVRTGRANVSVLDSIRVDYHGTPMPVNQLGTVTVPDPMSIVIAPWDAGAVPMIDKAIRTADLGLNPTNDGKVVRVPIPPLTEDRRKELLKVVNKFGEESRVALRNVRRDVNEHIKKLQKNKELSEDEMHHHLEQVDKALEKHLAEVDLHIAAKQKEITEF